MKKSDARLYPPSPSSLSHSSHFSLLTVITGGVGYDGVEHKENEYHGQEEAKVAEIDKQDGQVLETTEIPTENGQTNSHVGHCMSRGERRVNT